MNHPILSVLWPTAPAKQLGKTQRAEALSARAPDMSEVYLRAASPELTPEQATRVLEGLALHDKEATERAKLATERAQSHNATWKLVMSVAGGVAIAMIGAWAATRPREGTSSGTTTALRD